jgi:hypothetical protein
MKNTVLYESGLGDVEHRAKRTEPYGERGAENVNNAMAHIKQYSVVDAGGFEPSTLSV